MKSGELITARPISEETLNKLSEKYTQMLGEKVKLTEKVDPSIIGGFKVCIDNRVWDESIASVLSGIKDYLCDYIEESDDNNSILSYREGITEFSKNGNSHQHVTKGVVSSLGDGIAVIKGLPSCKYFELIDFGRNCYGIAMNLAEDKVDCILLGDESVVTEGQTVTSTGKVLRVPVGDCMLGRVVNPLGQPIDELGAIKSTETRPIECNAAPIIDRKPVSKSIQTGCLAIDSMVPLGKGQRQLIIGDRQIGKTTIAADTILNQKGKDVICIYVAIGQKASTVAQLVQRFKDAGAMDYTVVVAATASDSSPMQYIAPYSGCAIGEHFMYSGKDVLIVYDDLSKHAVAYRAISLLLKRAPGREAYPGDVFYLHSRLLERSACLSDSLGGGSMTALPIVETQEGDISAYIPTNVISITDGQIFLQTNLFNEGVRPAINVGLSVSRVGGAAQTKAIRKYSGKLRLELAQYREIEVFSRFGTGLDTDTQKMIRRGEQFVELLKQNQHEPLNMCDEAVLLDIFVSRLVEDVEAKDVISFKTDFLRWAHKSHQNIFDTINKENDVSDTISEQIKSAVKEYFQKQ